MRADRASDRRHRLPRRDGAAIRRIAALGALVPVLVAGTAAGAADWSVSFPSSISTTYSDNWTMALTEDAEREVLQTLVSPGLNIARDSDLASLRVDLGVVFGTSNDLGTVGEQRSPSLRIDETVYYSDSGSVSAGFGLSQSSTQTVEELEDSGDVTTQSTRRNLSLDLSWIQALSETTQFSLSGSQRRSTFSGGGGFVASKTQSASLSLSEQILEDLRVSTTASFRKYAPLSGTASGSNTYALGAGVAYQYSDTLSIDADYSFRLNRTKFIPNAKEGWNASLSVTQAFEFSTLSLTGSRSLDPSSVGGLNKNDRLGFSYTQPLDETWTWSLGGSWGRSSSGGNSTLNATLTSGLSYQVREDVSLRMDYTRRQRKAAGTSEKAQGNSVVLRLSATPRW